PLGSDKIDNRRLSKKQTEHRADAVECDVDLCVRNRIARQFFEMGTEFFEQFPAVDPLELSQLRQARRHGQGVSRKRACLINGTVGRKLIHDFASSSKCANRQTATDHFTKHYEIGLDPVNLLGASACDAKTGHHFIENEE